MSDPFLSPPFVLENLDRFTARSAILEAVKEAIPLFSGTLIDVGCGQMPYRPLILASSSRVSCYLGLDLYGSTVYRHRPDLVWDGRRIPLRSDSTDCAMGIEFLEHCPDPHRVLCEIHRVLRPGGVFFFTAPFLWPLHDVPYDEYRYTPFALERHLCCAGFENCQLRALGGWDASLAQMIGLWVRRRGMGEWTRLALSLVAKPVIAMLLRRDSIPHFDACAMLTGLCGTAWKGSPCP